MTEYIMSQHVLTRLENNVGGVKLCTVCKEPISEGDEVVSKRSGRTASYRRVRHRVCAKRIKMI